MFVLRVIFVVVVGACNGWGQANLFIAFSDGREKWILKGHWHICGHIHARLDDTYYFMRNRSKALNMELYVNNYTRALLNELIRNNQYFRGKFNKKE